MPFSLSLDICSSGSTYRQIAVNQLFTRGGIFYKIVLPSILFSTLTFIPKIVIKGGDLTLPYFLYATLGGCTYWFTSALVIAQLIYIILLSFGNRNIWFYFIAGIIMAIIGKICYENHVYITADNSAFPWMFKQGLISTFYFSCGGLYKVYESKINSMLSSIMIASLILTYLGTVLFFYDNIECTTSMCMIDPAGAIISIIGCILLIQLCKILRSNRLIDFVGNQSLGFYFLSGAIPLLLSLIINHFSIQSSLIKLILVFSLSVILSWQIVRFIIAYLPWTLNFSLLKKIKSNV